MCFIGVALYSQPVTIPIILKSIEPHATLSKCIKSEPSEGYPFEEVSTTVYRQITKMLGRYPTCTTYTIDSSYHWKDSRIYSNDISSIELDAQFDKDSISLKINQYTIKTHKSPLYGRQEIGALGPYQSSDVNLDTYSHSFLVQVYLPQKFDSLLFAEVFDFLQSDKTANKLDYKYSTHKVFDTSYFAFHLDTISTFTCFVKDASPHEKISIERNYYRKQDFGITLQVRINYNDLSNSFEAVIENIGVYKNENDQYADELKYRFPFAQVSRDDFLRYRIGDSNH